MVTSNAGEQLIEDCGSDSVVRVVVAILHDTKYVCIDDSIDWYILRDGNSIRVCNGLYYEYNNAGNLIRERILN